MPEKLHRCVNKVKAKGRKVNPWAVCTAALRKELERDGYIKRKEKR